MRMWKHFKSYQISWKKLLVDTYCRAVIILADLNTTESYSKYVNSEIVTNSHVDPEIGLLSNMIMIIMIDVIFYVHNLSAPFFIMLLQKEGHVVP